MSQENVEIVRAWVAKGVLGVTEAEFNESCQPAAELIALRSGTEGSYRGFAGFLRFQADTTTAFEKFQFRYEEFRAVGDRVLCGGTIRVRGAGSGAEMDIPAWHVVELRDGKISRWESFGSKEDAVKALGLEE
jgi:ketosteroid isomerase-like protein